MVAQLRSRNQTKTKRNMADGNVGDLMMSLGLKETITKDLDKIQKKFSGTDEVAKK